MRNTLVQNSASGDGPPRVGLTFDIGKNDSVQLRLMRPLILGAGGGAQLISQQLLVVLQHSYGFVQLAHCHLTPFIN